MTAHTAGNWLPPRFSSVVGMPIVASPSGRSICNVTAGHDEAEANGRLISAAPDLLHAAKLAMELIECIQEEEGFSPSVSIPANALRTAIAKATDTP